jgi:hypothetical protein
MKGFLLITLTATPEGQPFYKKLGWRILRTGMILPPLHRATATQLP